MAPTAHGVGVFGGLSTLGGIAYKYWPKQSQTSDLITGNLDGIPFGPAPSPIPTYFANATVWTDIIDYTSPSSRVTLYPLSTLDLWIVLLIYLLLSMFCLHCFSRKILSHIDLRGAATVAWTVMRFFEGALPPTLQDAISLAPLLHYVVEWLWSAYSGRPADEMPSQTGGFLAEILTLRDRECESLLSQNECLVASEDGFSQQVSMLKAAEDGLRKQVDCLAKGKHDVSEQVKVLEAAKVTLCNQVETLESKEDRPRQKVEALDEADIMLRCQVISLKNARDTAREQAITLQTANEGLSKEVDLLETYDGRSRKQVEKLQNVKNRLSERVKTLETAQDDASEQLKTLQAANDGLREQMEPLKTASNSLSGQLKSLEAAKDDASEQAKTLQTANDGLRERIEPLETANNGLSEQLKSLQAAKDDASEQAKTLQTANEGLCEHMKTLETDKEDSRKQMEALEAGKKDLREQVDAYWAANDNMGKQIGGLERTNDGLADEAVRLTDELELERTLRQDNHGATDASTAATSTGDADAAKDVTIATQQTEISDLETELRDQDKQIEDLKREHKDKIASEQLTIAELQDKVDGLLAAKTQSTFTFGSTQKQGAAKKNTPPPKDLNVDLLKQTLQRTKTALDSANRDLEKLQTKYDNEVEAADNEITQLKQQVNLSSAATKPDEVAGLKQELEGRQMAYETGLATLNEQLERVKGRESTLKAQKVEQKVELESLKEKLAHPEKGGKDAGSGRSVNATAQTESKLGVSRVDTATQTSHPEGGEGSEGGVDGGQTYHGKKKEKRLASDQVYALAHRAEIKVKSFDDLNAENKARLRRQKDWVAEVEKEELESEKEYVWQDRQAIKNAVFDGLSAEAVAHLTRRKQWLKIMEAEEEKVERAGAWANRHAVKNFGFGGLNEESAARLARHKKFVEEGEEEERKRGVLS